VNVYLKLLLTFATNKYIYCFNIKSLSFLAFVSLGKSFTIKETVLKVSYEFHQSHDSFHPQTIEVFYYKQTRTNSQDKDHLRRKQ